MYSRDACVVSFHSSETARESYAESLCKGLGTEVLRFLQVVSVAADSVASEMCSMEQLSKEIALRLTDIESMKDEEDRKHRLNLETQVDMSAVYNLMCFVASKLEELTVRGGLCATGLQSWHGSAQGSEQHAPPDT